MNIIINNGNLTAINRKLQTPIETILIGLRLDTATHADLDLQMKRRTATISGVRMSAEIE